MLAISAAGPTVKTSLSPLKPALSPIRAALPAPAALPATGGATATWAGTRSTGALTTKTSTPGTASLRTASTTTGGSTPSPGPAVIGAALVIKTLRRAPAIAVVAIGSAPFTPFTVTPGEISLGEVTPLKIAPATTAAITIPIPVATGAPPTPTAGTTATVGLSALAGGAAGTAFKARAHGGESRYELDPARSRWSRSSASRSGLFRNSQPTIVSNPVARP